MSFELWCSSLISYPFQVWIWLFMHCGVHHSSPIPFKSEFDCLCIVVCITHLLSHSSLNLTVYALWCASLISYPIQVWIWLFMHCGVHHSSPIPFKSEFDCLCIVVCITHLLSHSSLNLTVYALWCASLISYPIQVWIWLSIDLF